MMKITLFFASSKECRNPLSNIHFMHKWVLIFEKIRLRRHFENRRPLFFLHWAGGARAERRRPGR